MCGEGEREEGREGERKKGGGEKEGENQEREWGGRGRERLFDIPSVHLILITASNPIFRVR